MLVLGSLGWNLVQSEQQTAGGTQCSESCIDTRRHASGYWEPHYNPPLHPLYIRVKCFVPTTTPHKFFPPFNRLIPLKYGQSQYLFCLEERDISDRCSDYKSCSSRIYRLRDSWLKLHLLDQSTWVTWDPEVSYNQSEAK